MNDDINSLYDNPQNHDGEYPPDWDARRRKVYQRDDYTCQICGVKSGPHAGDDGVELQAHHVNWLSRGGTNKLENLTTLCDACHDKIGNYHAETHTGTPTFQNAESPTEESTATSTNDSSMVGGLIQAVIATPLYIFSALAFAELFTGGDILYGLLGGGFCLIYILIATAFPTRTFLYSVGWLLIFGLVPGDDPNRLTYLAIVAVILAIPIAIGLLLGAIGEDGNSSSIAEEWEGEMLGDVDD
jgi:hypothetical protein